MIRLVAIIQARMGSERLPGKVLMPLAGQPMIAHVVERVRRIAGVAEVVVATTSHPRDDQLAMAVAEMGVRVVRGSEQDVLARYHQAACESRAEAVMRVTSDCPLLSPLVSGLVAAEFLLRPERWDYVSNVVARTYPRGLDTEVFSMRALERAFREAAIAADREHVTSYIWRRPEAFRCQAIVDVESHADLRWTVDTPEDFRLVSAIYDELGAGAEYPDMLALVRVKPELSGINSMVAQKPLTA